MGVARSAFIIGGTGQIGRAVANALLGRGWNVILASRSGVLPADLARLGASAMQMDRAEPGSLGDAIGEGVDVVLDTVGYDERDAAQLLEVQESVGHLITVSSASVYRDNAGRTLDEARTNGFPELPEFMTEAQPTVPPGPETYSTKKVAMERALLDGARHTATVLRPCAIHGPHSGHPREWWFVKRLLDRRAFIPIAYEGRSQFHTSATVNIAELAAIIAEDGAGGIFNAVDPKALTVMEIGRAIMATLGREAEIIGVPDEGYPPTMGVSPWSIPFPFTVSDEAARGIGYSPIASYHDAIKTTCRWLIEKDAGDWPLRFPMLAAYPWNLFDYKAEDAWLAGHSAKDG